MTKKYKHTASTTGRTCRKKALRTDNVAKSVFYESIKMYVFAKTAVTKKTNQFPIGS